jgi:hypothetical protein
MAYDILYGMLVILVAVVMVMSMDPDGFLNFVAPFSRSPNAHWWEKPGRLSFASPFYSYWSEPFTNAAVPPPVPPKYVNMTEENPLMEYRPGTGEPADVYNDTPYHLLQDTMQQPRTKESISCVNSRSCYATDFQRMTEKTGNFRQMTNNYKRNYPDSCTSPMQELVLNFYKTDAMAIPENNTGGSVSFFSQ